MLANTVRSQIVIGIALIASGAGLVPVGSIQV